jgi:hypothetical protein
MKHSKKKKQGVGGRPHKWASGKTKTIRVPVAFLKEVLAFINELDRREQERKLLESLRSAIYQAVASRPPEINYLIFFECSPTSSTSGGGRLSQGGKEKFVTRLAFRRARNF